jgi:hypothetical protein
VLGEGLTKDPSSSALDYVYTYTATGDESEDLSGIGLTVDLVDAAGNIAAVLPLGSAVFDFTPPALLGEPVVAPLVAKAGGFLLVTFTASEELGADPLVTIGGKTMTKGQGAAPTYVFTALAEAADGEGDKQIEIALSDKAGNPSGGIAGPTVRFDFVPPEVSNLATDRARYSSVAGHDVVTLTADCAEDVGGGLVATVGGRGMMCAAWSAVSPNYTCTYAAKGDEGEGVKDVSVTTTDAAGNAGSGSRTVEFDFSGPVLTLAVQPQGRPARLGELVTVGVAASEALDANGISLGSGALNLGTPAGSGTNFSWTYTVKAGDDGSFNLSAVATDVVGNPAAAPATGTVSLDGVVPVVSNTVLDPPRVAKGGQFTLTFDVSETPGADPEVTLSNGIDAPVQMTKTSSSGLSFTYTGVAPDAGSAPFYGLTVSVSDAAGNRGMASVGTVEIDNVAPQVAGLEVTPKAAKKGDTIRAVLSATETLSGPPALSASNGTETITLVPVDQTAGKISYSYEYPLTDASPQGTFAVQAFTLSDAAGNEKAVASEAGWGFFVDSKEPVVGAVTADKPKYSRVVGFDSVTVTFDCTEDVGTGLKATVGGAAMTCGAWQATSPNYTCTYTIQPGDTGGVKPVEVKTTDAAGNTAYGSGSVEYDFSSPWLISAKPGQAAYKLNDSVLYTVNVSEPLASRPTVKVFKDGVEQPGFFGVPVQETDTSFTYTKTVTGGMDGTYTVKVDLTDKAGNGAADLSADGFVVDATPPVVTEQSLTTNNPNFNTLAKDGEVVTAVFTVNENPPSDPAVTISGQAMNFVSKTGSGPWTFTYNRTAATADGDGAKGVTVTTTDAAGNVTVSGFTSSVTYDFISPAVVSGSASVQLIPDYPATNPLPTVTAATNGTKVRVTFVMSEPVTPDPKVVTRATGKELAFVSKAGVLYSYEGTLSGLTAGQEITENLDVSASPQITDIAGNVPAGALAITTFAIDTKAPGAPDVATADRIVYKRVPWGSDATGGAKRFTVRGAANALPADASNVFMYDSSAPGPSSLIGSQTKRPDSGFDEFTLNGSDRARIYAAAADAAGNLSAAVEVKDAEWIATMGYKVPGSTFENPHRHKIRPWSAESMEQPGFSEGGFADGLGTIGLPALNLHGAGAWRRRTFDDPLARESHAMTYDSTRGKTVMFGGWTEVYNGETWEWDGTSWAEKTPADPEGDGNPSARRGHAMAFDSARGNTILFGGWTGNYDGETWEWNGESWTRKTPADPEGDGGPSARDRHAMAFDSARGKTILFGGWMDGYLGDTWEWDGTSWAKKTPADPESDGNPTARRAHAMTYDSTRRKTVLFGGLTGAYNGETWEWDGTSWAKKTPADAEGDGNPLARERHAMVYDNARAKAVLFGGETGIFDDETWEWNGDSWAKKAPADPEGDANPLARRAHAMAYDSAQGKTILFGGWTGNYDGETWEWNGESWAKKTPADPEGDGNPSARRYHALVYDSARGKTVLFGGDTGDFGDETWECDGKSWAKKAPADPEGDANPAGRHGHAMAFDSAREKTVLFGGRLEVGTFSNETWEWDGTSWAKKTPADPEGDGNPTARRAHAMAYDSAQGKTVLFGGNSGVRNGETWDWDGTSWAKKTPADPEGDGNPSARFYHAMAYDKARGKTILFGGDTGSLDGETWEWDGTSWGKMTPTDPNGDANPSPRFGHAMVYDSAQGKTVLFGGSTGALEGETWEWDGTSWAKKTSADPEGDSNPSGRYLHALAHESARGKTVVFGGDTGSLDGETWEWDRGAAGRPGQTMGAVFASAGVSATPTWKSVSSTFYSGGVGYPSGVATNGVDLKVWDEGMWKTVATNNSPPNDPQLVSWTTTDPLVMSRLFFGDQQTLNFAVTPVAPNGTGIGEISVDYVEVVVKYRQQ